MQEEIIKEIIKANTIPKFHIGIEETIQRKQFEPTKYSVNITIPVEQVTKERIKEEFIKVREAIEEQKKRDSNALRN